MKKNKIGTYSFVAEPFHVDFTGHLHWSVLGNHLLNCAGFHAMERGFGMAEVNQNNYTWVLSRLAIEMNEMPEQYEEFCIDTWVENVYRLFTDRNFAIYGKSDGKIYGYARSVWAMINMATRKPADLLDLHGDSLLDFIETEKPCPIEKPGRIRVGESMPVRTLGVCYNDIDLNGHVNSIRYMEHITDLYPVNWYVSHRIRRFEIAYVAESYAGDNLSFFREETVDGSHDIEVRKNTGGENPEGEVVCRSKLKFDNK